MNESLTSKWDKQYSREIDTIPRPARVLTEFSHLLPSRGIALDVACGLGGNALFLAERSMETWAIDISPIAIEKLRQRSNRLNLNIRSIVQDVNAFDWDKKRFDVILVSRFLERGMAERIINSLEPEGILFYQTFVAEKSVEIGPKNPSYLLLENELLEMFGDLKLLAYREEGRVGDLSKGFRNEAFLVGQRRC